MIANWKNYLLIISSTFIVLLFIEIFVNFYFKGGLNIWQKESHYLAINKKDPNNYINSDFFDKDLGWDTRVNPYSQKTGNKETNYIAQSYGDSFIQSGWQKTGKTWQSQFLENTGEGILNFGSGGYGLDQAILKFEKYGANFLSKENTKYVFLGLYEQTFRRSLSHYSYYYFDNSMSWVFALKPRFVFKNGQFELLKLPCKNADCLMQELSDYNSITNNYVRQYDYWYNKEQTQPALSFPKIVSYLKAIPHYIQNRLQRNYQRPFLFVNDESIELTKYLIQRFNNQSIKLGMTPVMLLLYSKYGLDGILNNKREDEWFFEFFKKNDINYIDTSIMFTRYIRNNGTMINLFVEDGHYNDKGDSLVAASIKNYFNQSSKNNSLIR